MPNVILIRKVGNAQLEREMIKCLYVNDGKQEINYEMGTCRKMRFSCIFIFIWDYIYMAFHWTIDA